jgi:hypothetical protein
MDLNISTFVMVLVPLIAAPITTAIVQLLKRPASWLDMQSDVVKRLVVAVVAIILNWIGLKLGINLPSSIAGVTPDVVTTIIGGLLSALAAMGIYGFKKKEPEVVEPLPGASSLRNTSSYDKRTLGLLVAVTTLTALTACDNRSKGLDTTVVDTTKSIVTTPVKDTNIVITNTTVTKDTVRKTDNAPASAKKPK